MLDLQTGWVQGGAAVAWAVLESTRGSGILTGRGCTTAVSMPGAASPPNERLGKTTNHLLHLCRQCALQSAFRLTINIGFYLPYIL